MLLSAQAMKFAFIGFRHAHIFDLLTAVREHADCELVAACEEDAAARAEATANHQVEFTHTSNQALLDEVECDVIVVGEAYGRRGGVEIAALEKGRHVISDKPLCTSLKELDRIEALAKEKNLCVGCQLDITRSANFRALRSVIQSGKIGEVVTLNIGGQHPLLLGKRPQWYFEKGMHGGTINDIGVHVFDLVPWLTSKEITGVRCARSWNAKATETPWFEDSAQMLLDLDNNASVFADLSYLAPDRTGYSDEHYWRITVHGTRGLAETSGPADHVKVVTDSSEKPEIVAAGESDQRAYFIDFLAEIAGSPRAGGHTTARVLKVARGALEAQQAAGGS